jgi:hypothetical protein
MNAYQIHLNMIAEKHPQKMFNVQITRASGIETNLHIIDSFQCTSQNTNALKKQLILQI